jgi:hypothetical protein
MTSPQSTTVTFSWPDSLEAVEAAPAHHAILLENERVRVLEARAAPGEIVPLHTNRWPIVSHILSWSDFVPRDETGAVTLGSRATGIAPPQVAWSAPLPSHTLENVGTTDIHIISIEVKDAGAERGTAP